MPYAIGSIIHGVDLTDTSNSYGDDRAPDAYSGVRSEINCLVEEDYQIENRYPGDGGDAFFGVEIGKFDECTRYTAEKLIGLLTTTEEHRTKFAQKLSELLADVEISQDLKDAISRAPVTTFIVWGTS